MAVSELPGNPNAVWTVKKNVDGNIHTNIYRLTFILMNFCFSLQEQVFCTRCRILYFFTLVLKLFSDTTIDLA